LRPEFTVHARQGAARAGRLTVDTLATYVDIQDVRIF